MHHSDNLVFADETTIVRTADAAKQWKILLVDDEPSVHDVTLLALNDFEFKQRKAEFLHAYSAEQARGLLQQHPDIAVALIDVVMETDDAGVQLVRWIREELCNSLIRLVLRTGQPGQAPERQVVLDHDINDYKEKADLTASKLFTLMVTSIRSYQTLLDLEKSRTGLLRMLGSSSTLSTHGGIEMFVEGVLLQLQAVFGVDETAFYISQQEGSRSDPFSPQDLLVATGLGEFGGTRRMQWRNIEGSALAEGIERTIDSRQTRFVDDSCYVYFVSERGNHCVLFINRLNHPLDHTEKELIDVFCRNINRAFDNLDVVTGR